MIDIQWIGHAFRSSELVLERGRLRFFAKAIGETNPVYTDVEAARAAGYSDLPAPPTFLFAAELDSGAMFERLDAMAIPLGKLLHGEQGFEYFAPVVAGDTGSGTNSIVRAVRWPWPLQSLRWLRLRQARLPPQGAVRP